MLQLVALVPAVPRMAHMTVRASICLVTSIDLLAQACAARPRDVVLVPTGELDAGGIRQLRRSMQPDTLLVGVAPTLAAATAATHELSRYDYVITATGLEAELISLLANRTTLELAGPA